MPSWNVYEKNREYKCEHPNFQPTQATKSNGVVCVYLQCLDCGEKIKETGKVGYDVVNLPLFDTDLRDQMREGSKARIARLQELWNAEYERERQNEDAVWWENYNTYLRSKHWAELRTNVLRRDDYTCQNCFNRVSESTAHVHHKHYTGYNRLGYSFAFECVTLCRGCHDAYHK